MDVVQKIIDFIISNWSYISVALVVIANMVIFLIKKKPIKVVDSLKEMILQLLPGFIAGAEEIIGSKHGSQKMDMVIEAVESWFVKNGFEFTPYYRDFVKKCAENILSTPQKKGD